MRVPIQNGDMPVSQSLRWLLLGAPSEKRIVQAIHRRCAWCKRTLGGIVQADLVTDGFCGSEACRASFLGRRSA